MEGDWSADSLVVTSRLNSDVVADLIALGATLTLLVEPSGRYTEILEGYGQSSSEIRRLTIDGPDIVTLPQSPAGPASRAVWGRVGDRVILVGPSLFDFNLGGSPESAILRQVLSPRSD
jgi:hypothetical protein